MQVALLPSYLFLAVIIALKEKKVKLRNQHTVVIACVSYYKPGKNHCVY